MSDAGNRSGKEHPRNIEAIYPLSPMQQGMLFHSLYAPESGAYFEQFSCILRGVLNVTAFEQAWREVVRRQSVLRTAFVWKRLDRMLQVVHKEVELPLEVHDWRTDQPASNSPTGEYKNRLAAYLQADRARGFDLAKAPLMRLALFQIAENAHYFVWSHHHALMDGWSMPLLLKEVLAYYDAFAQAKTLYLPPQRPYREYINWLQAQDPAAAQTYWKGRLSGLSAPTALVFDRPATPDAQTPAAPTQHNQERLVRLAAEKTARLMTLAKRERVTLNTLLQAAWGLVLSRYTGEQDVLFGATVAGRPADLPGAETMIGLFINTLPVRVNIPADARLVEWLQGLQAQAVETRQYEYSSLVQIQEWSEIPRGFPLFESILVFENYPVEDTLRGQFGSGQGLKIENIQSAEQTNYPLTLVSGPSNQLEIKASFDPTRFAGETIQRLLGHLQTVLEAMVTDMDQPGFSERRVSDISILTPEEIETIASFNFHSSTSDGSPQPASVLAIFEEQARKAPEAIALVVDQIVDHGSFVQGVAKKSAEITYAELNRRAGLLGDYLRQQGVGPDSLVGIFIERSLEMIVGLLGTWKAGGAYLPLDPNYPPERIHFMLADSRAAVVLTQAHLVDQLQDTIQLQPAAFGGQLPEILAIDQSWEQIAAAAGGQIEKLPVRPDQLAYVIYTSGSTGKPKGVMIEHRSVVNHALNYADLIELTPQDRCLQFISLSFDASVEEIFPPLITGAALVLSPVARELTTADFFSVVQRQGISVLHLPAAFWHQCVDDMLVEEIALPGSLRLLLTGGESPSIDKIKSWLKLSEGFRQGMTFVNAYGPTETTITATAYRIHQPPGGLPADKLDSLLSGASLPIGRSLPNVQVYLLDRQLQRAPVGIAGEICIGGLGVARGYLNQPGLTAEKFIELPPSVSNDRRSGSGRRLYRTGDLGRYLPDGNIEFVGRLDQQVKIRGFRIELGEIEAVIGQHPSVDSVAVLARELVPGNTGLVAYLTLTPDHGGATGDERVERIRRYLLENLPDYMLPAAFILLESMPLTPNGKIDRQALPAPDGSHLKPAHEYIAPRTPVETLIAGVWEQVLGVGRIGIYDNFFDLGGHSLLATQVISRLRNVFQIDIPLRDLFETLTIAGLGQQIETLLRSGAGLDKPVIERLPRAAGNGVPLTPPPLSFSQQRLWFLDQLAPGNLFYNIPLAVEIEGKLDALALEKSLNEIIARHAVLRTNFKAINGTPVQVVRPEFTISLAVEDLEANGSDSGSSPEAVQRAAFRIAEEQTRQAFNLESDPLVRARLLRLADDKHVFLLTMHHIVSDGWSMGILFKEISVLYAAFAKGFASPLPELKFQYFDYASSQRAWLQGEQLDRQLNYWKKQLANQPRILDLPTDHPRPPVQSSNGAIHSFEISAELSEQLNQLSRQEGVTLFMMLLAAFQVLLYRYSGQTDISVGTAIANRNRAEIENMIGFFVNTLVLRTDLSGEPDFKELLKRVRETTLGAYAHQDLPFEMLVEALQPERDLSHTPLFQVAFALQNTTRFDVAARAADLAADEKDRLRFNPIDLDTGSAKFDMTLSLAETPGGLVGSLEYNRDLYEPDTIRRMIAHYGNLLEAITRDLLNVERTRSGPAATKVSLPIERLALLSQAELQMMLVDWNQTELATPTDRCAHELFEARAAANPSVAAIRYGAQSLSYGELDERADILADYLRGLGVAAGVFVGLSTERSFEMVIGILGILKAGGGYVPLDPSYPADRLAYMLQDSQVPVLLTQSHLHERLPLASTADNIYAPRVIDLDKFDYDQAPLASKSPRPAADPEQFAYMIYTSGSTGKPKGTILRHRGLCNLAEAQRQAFEITSASRILQFSPLSFDASVWEMFMALANGATLVLASQETLASAPDLLNLLAAQAVTTVTLPPSVLGLFSAEQVSAQALPALQTVISAGEACTPDLVAKWAAGRTFFNAYGPTETTVCASMYRCSGSETEPPPIGRPIANAKIYILDKYLQPVPINVPAELHVAGVSLAAGYRNQPGMTAEKFIDNPFNSENVASFQRLYKTGDLARFRADGNIEFLGRIDQQVKVRGFRIELGEIESALSKHPQVAETAVTVQDASRLVAFVALRPADGELGAGAGNKLDVSDLRNFLRQSLPEYMLPSAFVFLEEFPLSPSGKIDRKALAAMKAVERPDLESVYTAPRNPTEERLVQISAELLHLEKVGVYDNFFELGGHSLLATQFVSRVRDEFGVELPLRKVFENPTIAGIAAAIDEARVIDVAQGGQAQTGAPVKANKAADRAKLLEMLQRIGELSDDEVKTLLELKKRSEE